MVQLGKHHSEETKQKIRISHLGKKRGPRPEGVKQKISATKKLRGLKPWLGKHHTEEEKRKIGLGNKGKKLSCDTRLRMSQSRKGIAPPNKGKKFTMETKNKQSISAIKRISKFGIPFLGKHHSDISKKKQSTVRKLKWDNYTEEERKTHISKLTRTNRISKPQKELYYFLKQIFPDAQLEYFIKTEETYRFADIGVPSLKIDFEYDGEKWHENRKEKDQQRDKELANVGWATFRINKISLKILSQQKLCLLEKLT